MVIREHREERGITQKQLAKEAHVTNCYLCQLESGKRKNPSMEVLIRIAKALDVSVEKLLGEQKAG